jgi:uncharacterized membrane protein
MELENAIMENQAPVTIPKPHAAAPSSMSLSRVTAMSDGVFAIAITLLVFNLKTPDLPDGDLNRLPQILWTAWPSLLSYVLSFLIIGMYWVAHHNIFHHIQRSNRILLWLNLLFLMCVAFIPFSAGLLGRYERAQSAIVLYGATLIITGLALQVLWSYVSHRRRLTDDVLSGRMVRRASFKILSVPMVCTISILASFVSPRISLGIYLLVPLFFILPDGLDRYWIKVSERHAARAAATGKATGPSSPPFQSAAPGQTEQTRVP